ncbi:hypothetical protein BVY01_03410 [bacterium I07]|nr:hypothetical protein BVY01_03410 [bacterium I07]
MLIRSATSLSKNSRIRNDIFELIVTLLLTLTLLVRMLVLGYVSAGFSMDMLGRICSFAWIEKQIYCISCQRMAIVNDFGALRPRTQLAQLKLFAFGRKA